MNILKSENTQLKAKVLQGEKELIKKDKEIKRLLEQLNSPLIYNVAKESSSRKPTGTHLVINLKRHITEMQKENNSLKEGLAEFKKSLKTTRIQELEAEVKSYMVECIRLRGLLEKVMNEKPYTSVDGIARAEVKMKEQTELIAKLKEENERLLNRVKEGTEEAKEWKRKAEQKENSKSLVKEQIKEISNLKGQIKHMKKESESQKQAQNLQKVKVDLETQEREHEKKIKDLEAKLNKSKQYKGTELELLEEVKATEKIKKIISNEAIHPIAIQLRLNLILNNISASDIRNILFKNCEDSDKISIHELSRVFRRNPTSLTAEAAQTISRYIIEPRVHKEINFNELLEMKVQDVIKALTNIIGSYSLDFNKNKRTMQKAIWEKFGDKLETFADSLYDHADEKGNLSIGALEEIYKKLKVELSKEEMDYILLIMYVTNKDLNKLHYENLLENLGEFLKKFVIHKAEINKEIEQIEEVPENTLEEKTPMKKNVKQEKEMSLTKDMTETEMLTILQKLFSEIAEGMVNKGYTVNSLFKGKANKKLISGEEVELVSPETFNETMKELGVREFSASETNCLSKVLTVNSKETGYKIKDLAKILEDCTTPKSIDYEEKIENLDKISMVILLALSEYLNNEKSTLKSLLGNTIYNIAVEIENDKYDIEVINSTDFFEILNKIGIEVKEEDNERLKSFLAIGPEYTNKLSLEKLKTVMNEFTGNKELRNKANNYYNELKKENKLQEESYEDESPN